MVRTNSTKIPPFKLIKENLKKKSSGHLWFTFSESVKNLFWSNFSQHIKIIKTTYESFHDPKIIKFYAPLWTVQTILILINNSK